MRDEELQAELAEGERLAGELVEHVRRMGAGATAKTATASGGPLDGQEFVVLVLPKGVNVAAAVSMVRQCLK